MGDVRTIALVQGNLAVNPNSAALVGANAYAVEYTGDQADDLIADSGTAIPFLPVNAFIQASEFADLYYALIGAKANIFDFEKHRSQDLSETLSTLAHISRSTAERRG